MLASATEGEPPTEHCRGEKGEGFFSLRRISMLGEGVEWIGG